MFPYERTQTITKGNFLAETPKDKSHTKVADLPEGIRELVAVPPEASQQPILPDPSQGSNAHSGAATAPPRPKTAKEKLLDDCITERQAIITKLKEKNPIVNEARKKISALIPAVRQDENQVSRTSSS